MTFQAAQVGWPNMFMPSAALCRCMFLCWPPPPPPQAQQATLGTELLAVQKNWLAQQQHLEQVRPAQQAHSDRVLLDQCTVTVLSVHLYMTAQCLHAHHLQVGGPCAEVEATSCFAHTLYIVHTPLVCPDCVVHTHMQEHRELQLAKEQLEADCRITKQQLAETQAAAAAAKGGADAAHDHLRGIMLQLKLAAQSLADIHRAQEQQQQAAQQQQQTQQSDEELPQWQLNRVQQLYLQIVHELAVLPRLEEQPAAAELFACVPVMLRLPRLMARVVQTEQQHHQQQQVRYPSRGLMLVF